MHASLITPPASEPVTLDELKVHLRLEGDEENSLLTRQLAAARSHVENSTRRVLITQVWRGFLDRWPPKRRLVLPVAPVTSIVEIRVIDAVGVASIVSDTNYKLEWARTPPHLLLQSAMLSPTAFTNGIEIDMVCGYGAASSVPVPLKEAILRLAANMYEYRSERADIAKSSTIEALLAPYRVVWP